MTKVPSKIDCGPCGTCGSTENIVGVASSALGAFSQAWCARCLQEGAEPFWMVKGLTDDSKPEDFNSAFHEAMTFKDGRYLTIREAVWP